MIRGRLELVIVGSTWRSLSERTGFNHETLRRACLKGRIIRAELIAVLADLYGVSGHWLLTGRGPMFEAGCSGTEVAVPEASMRELIMALVLKLRHGPMNETEIHRLERWFADLNAVQLKVRKRSKRSGKSALMGRGVLGLLERLPPANRSGSQAQDHSAAI
jgi:hypothetical protein